MENAAAARVISVGRNHVWLVFDDETLARTAELRKTQEREMLVPGDHVQARRRDDGSAYVVSRSERRTTLERLTPAGRRKVMAANIDAVLIALAHDTPAPNLPMIDELIAFAEAQQLRVMLVFSKADLVDPETAATLRATYEALEYPVFEVDSRVGKGVPELLTALQGLETLLIGASGVGKSTLFRAIGGQAVIGDVSERTGRGKQTTSSGRLFHLASGTLIDSPGIGEFSLDDIEARDIAPLWRELQPLLGSCRFLDCRHEREPECGLRTAAENGSVASSRWQSYRRAFERREHAERRY